MVHEKLPEVLQLKAKRKSWLEVVWRHDVLKHDENLVKSFVSYHRKITCTEITSQRSKTVSPSFRIYWKWLVQKQLKTNQIFFFMKFEFNRETFLDYVGEVITSWNVNCINSSVPQKSRLKPSNSRLKKPQLSFVERSKLNKFKNLSKILLIHFWTSCNQKVLLIACQPIASLVRANQKLEFVYRSKFF